jgi:thiol-disulfide isomerase/thioredoxin
MDPTFKRLSRKYAQARFVKIDVEEYPELFEYYGSGTSIPQVVVFKLGQPVAYESGFRGDQQLDDWLFINL